MKRSRDEETEAADASPAEVVDSAVASSSSPPPAPSPSSSPYALHFEVIYGITSRRSGPLEAERAAVLSRLLGPSSSSSPTVAVADVATLMEEDLSVCLGGFTRELVYQQLLDSSQEGSLLRLLTVELVANDGRTLVMASPQNGAASASATTASPLLIDVEKPEIGDEAVAHPADLLLLRCQPQKPASVSDDAAGTSSTTAEWATHVEFVTYNTSLFTAQDADLWREAVEGSVGVVVRWVSALLEQPPGLGQLAFLEAAASSSGSQTGSSSGSSNSSGGWRRALQLPLLLRIKPEVMRSADTETLDRLRRTIGFALRSILTVFVNVESAMRLPHLCQRLVYLFLSSPLFVDGASQVAMQLVSSDSVASTRQTMAHTLQSCMQLGLQYASASTTLIVDTAATSAELRGSAQQTRNGFEVVLSRISHVWLLHSASLKSKRAAGNATSAEAAVCEVLESVAASGVLRQVVRWLQLEEDLRRAHDQQDSTGRGGNSGSSGGADTADALGELLLPPTLRQLQDGRYLQNNVVAEQLAALRRTYNPYLNHEIQQFLRGTAVAAYAELYGNTARAVRRVTRLSEGAAELRALGRLDGVIAVSVEAVEAMGLRAGGLEEYSLTEVQQHAAFGLPVRFTIRQAHGHARNQLDTLDALLHATRCTGAMESKEADASLFAYAVVQLNGQWIVFPLVLTQLVRDPSTTKRSAEDGGRSRPGNSIVAHVLRDADMLTDFVATSAAAAEDGQAQAWVIVGEEATVQRRAPRRRRGNKSNNNNNGEGGSGAPGANAMGQEPMERVLPSGTPALTYIDCLRRLHALSVTVRQCEAGSNSSKGRPNAGGGSSAASGTAGRPFDSNSAYGMWTEHFMDGAVPTQKYVAALTSSVTALLSGTGVSGKENAGPPVPPSAVGGRRAAELSVVTTSLQTLLATMNDAVHFSSAQMEALYSLTNGSGLTSTTAGPPPRPGATSTAAQSNVPVSVKAVDGCTGSGKTAILYASGLVRGKLHAAARQEQQRTVQARLRQKIVAVRHATAALRNATVAELFVTSAELRGGRNLLDEASRAAAEARQQYQALNEGFLYCSTPFLLRPAAVTSTIPEAVEHLLFDNAPRDANGDMDAEEEEGGAAAAAASMWKRSEVNSLATLLRESHERSLNAPLAAQLNAQLRLLLSTGLWSGQCRTAAVVAAPLLALTMSARDTADVMARAAAAAAAVAGSSADPSSYPPSRTWAQLVALDVWPAMPVTDAIHVPDPGDNNEEDEDALVTGSTPWEVLTAAPEDRFAPVSMPSTTHLSKLSAEQLEGWHSVYLDKQAELAHHIHTAVHESVKSLFRYFLDLVFGVAATSQSTRHTLLAATPVELTQRMQLPFLWSWQPSHVCIDDLDAVQDGIFAVLTPASSVVYSLTAEVPSFQERRRSHERVVLALLRSLRTELQRCGALTTTALRESLRCRRAEVQLVLRYTIEDARALAQASLEEAASGGAHKEDGDADEKKDEERDEEHNTALDLTAPPPAFPGLASYSAVEAWSHGTSMENCVAADATATVFLMSHLLSYRNWRSAPQRGSPISFGIYTNTAAAAETVSEALTTLPPGQTLPGDAPSPPSVAPPLYSVRVWKESLEDMGSETSFAAATGAAAVAYTNLEEAECETDVGIVCLSGLLEVATAALKGNPASHRPDVRQQQWRQLWAEAADGSPSLFVTRLQWWLWRLLRRVRYGVFFVGSRELFACVPLFARVESLVKLQRRLLAPKDPRAYWLPAEVGASVLAMVCPDHYKCRRTATIHERENAGEDGVGSGAAEAGEEPEVEVRTHGPACCTTLCLRPYKNCPNPSHACLLPCHVQQPLHHASEPVPASADSPDTAAEPVEEDTVHACCPYPCGTVLPCGHLCHRICGAPCDPCTYAGLTELSCGQRVVSGIDGNKVVQYTVFHHFQERRCGEATELCRTPVSVPCSRCGARTLVPCHRVTAQQARRQHTAEEEGGGEQPSTAATTAAYTLGETACAGCVALYNKVAVKFGYERLPVPPADLTEAPTTEDAHHDNDDDGAEEGMGDTPGSAFARHGLSPEAQAELRKEFTIAAKKSELLVMKEALEIGSGRATDKTDFAVYRAKYEALKATQAAQGKAWKDAYQATMDAWAVKLRKALEVQYALNTELDTLMPRLVSEATDEAEVQRLQFIE